jgi:GDP-L-fucose synthase
MASVTGKTRIFVAGHSGMVGSAIIRQLERDASVEIITRSRHELDLTNQAQVQNFFSETQIDQIYIAAAKVGGIYANNIYPAEFIYQNIMIEANIIHAAHQNDVQQLLFLGSSCIYPKHAEQPMREDALLTGVLEATNEPYALAKIAGIKLCESYNRQYGRDYRSVMPTNLYGINDNFHLDNAHVIPALIRRIHEAKVTAASCVEIWGTGKPMREFLYVDDMAEACVFVMNLGAKKYQNETQSTLSHINVGFGRDCSIRELVSIIAKVVGYQGEIKWDVSKPDGTARKLMDTSLLKRLGWESSIELPEGLERTYEWFLRNENFRGR